MLEIHQDNKKSFLGIVFIASIMFSVLILMSESVFDCGCPNKSFGYLFVIVVFGMLKTQLSVHLAIRSFFCCLVSGSPLPPGEVQSHR